MRTTILLCLLLSLGLFSSGCGDDDADDDDDTADDDDSADDDDDDSDGGVTPECADLPAAPSPTCEPLASDYVPGRDGDEWDECAGDDGDFHPMGDSISSVARAEAFDRIGDLIYDVNEDPDDEAFLAARMIYQEEEGLDSRVVRRYDPRFTVPEGTDCTMDGVPEMYPDYCVGPGILLPIVLDSFRAGIEGGDEPSRVYAARIEGALLWFLFSSLYKETYSCTDTIEDCDSAHGYYAGGATSRDDELAGLAARVNAVDPDAHDRIWDGLLATSCWREDDDGALATDLETRDQARTQMDHAALDGVAAIVRDRLAKLCAATDDDVRRAHLAFVQVLGRALLHDADVRDEEAAEALHTAFESDDPSDIDVAATMSALDAIFECP